MDRRDEPTCTDTSVLGAEGRRDTPAPPGRLPTESTVPTAYEAATKHRIPPPDFGLVPEP